MRRSFEFPMRITMSSNLIPQRSFAKWTPSLLHCGSLRRPFEEAMRNLAIVCTALLVPSASMALLHLRPLPCRRGGLNHATHTNHANQALVPMFASDFSQAYRTLIEPLTNPRPLSSRSKTFDWRRILTETKFEPSKTTRASFNKFAELNVPVKGKGDGKTITVDSIAVPSLRVHQYIPVDSAAAAVCAS
jgi:hypothetical protein